MQYQEQYIITINGQKQPEFRDQEDAVKEFEGITKRMLPGDIITLDRVMRVTLASASKAGRRDEFAGRTSKSMEL